MNRLDTESKNIINSAQAITSIKDICKELIENAIDAKATFIQIQIKNDLIQVADNGIGFDSDFMIERNATSKLIDEKGFGFRGTALHSIAVLCHLNLRSCQNPPLGYEWKYENGELKSKSQIACSKGTVITITNFFGNVPVRLLNLQKHYKKYVKECLDLVYYYTFLPIRFKIVSDKTMETNGQLIDSIRTLFGSKQVQQMTFIDNDIVTGYISKPNMQALRKEKRQYCFLNNRPCLLPKLGKLLSNVYEFVGLFPCFVLFLKIDSNRFDRNVTPDKLSLIMEDDDLFLGEVVDVISAAIEPLRGSMDMLVSSSSQVSVLSQLGMSQSKLGQAASQVGFKEPQKRALSQLEIDFPVKQIVIEDSVDSADPLVKDSLGKDTESPTTPISSQKVYDSPVRFVDKLWKEREDAEHRFSKLIGQDHPQRIQLCLNDIKNYKHDTSKDYTLIQTQLEEPLMIKKSDFQSLKIHGQFNLGFILVSFKEYMFIIDQHASDEKSRYEMYCRSKITTQPLISYLILIRPQRLEMTPQQEYELSTRVDVVRDAGFDVRLANGKWYLVGVPQTQGMLLNQDDLFEFLVLQPGQLCTKLKKLYASKACRSAVMIGDVLTKKQMQEIVLKMGELDSPWNCPHGRPTMRLLCKLT